MNSILNLRKELNKVSFTRFISNLVISVLVIFLLLQLSGCENKERFYRPDVPQKLCTIGIFDIDDTITYDALYGELYHLGYKDTVVYDRYISFEKSYQFEFPEEVDDSLRDLSFRISNENEDMFVFQNKQTTKNIELILPKRLKFESGRKYFMHACEKETPDIYAEIEVPMQPPEPKLLSFKTELQKYFTILPNGCYDGIADPGGFWARNTEIEFSFSNDNPNSYYAILLIGSNPDYRYSLQNGSNLLDFTVLETNTDGFFHTFHGRKTIRQFCNYPQYPLNLTNFRFDPSIAYYIDGSKITDQNCTLKIFTQYGNGVSFPDPRTYIIRLISIPKELYFFEKSLYTYKEVYEDPFAEPVNLKGNIKAGNGIFAICRSRDLLVYNSRWIK